MWLKNKMIHWLKSDVALPVKNTKLKGALTLGVYMLYQAVEANAF